MIQSRNSEDILSKEIILSKISEYQIFKYFCPNFKNLGVKFLSDLRPDRTPTVSIALINNRLYYKDFGFPEHSFDCFSYVGFKYNIDFLRVLTLIDSTFGFGLSSSSNSTKIFKIPKNKTITVAHKHTVISVKIREWEKRDAEFWKQFEIPKQILCKFDVLPISHYWINETRFTCHTISYRYKFKDGYKIYSPNETDYKWRSNVGMGSLQGYNQLPEIGEIVFLTSSLKDVMCLEVLGYPSFALQSEMLMPSEEIIQNLKKRFKKVIVFYDNDYLKENNPGQTMAKKICDKYKIENIFIPDRYREKDISDLIKTYDLQTAKNVIISKTL